MRASAMAIIALAAACSSTPRAAGPGPSGGPPSASEGVVAFATVQAVLQHPRCQNCHPAGDAPLQGDDGHVHLQYVKRGPLGRGEVGQECSTCHGPANPPSNYGLHIPPGVSEGWRMPPPDAPLGVWLDLNYGHGPDGRARVRRAAARDDRAGPDVALRLDGRGVLLEQGALAFAWWFDREPDRAAMSAALQSAP